MSKELETCFKRIKNLQVCVDYEKDIVKSVDEILPNSCNKVEQALIQSQEQYLKTKAFELIILKNVDVKEIRPNATAKAYNSKMPYYRQNLTDDEFKFLKEMVHRLDCEEILFELPKEY